MRYRFVHSQHAVAEALRLQRIAWRFLGALGLFLFTPARNKYGVAPARSLRAGRVTVRETISEEQTRGSVRGYRRDVAIACERKRRCADSVVGIYRCATDAAHRVIRVRRIALPPAAGARSYRAYGCNRPF